MLTVAVARSSSDDNAIMLCTSIFVDDATTGATMRALHMDFARTT